MAVRLRNKERKTAPTDEGRRRTVHELMSLFGKNKKSSPETSESEEPSKEARQSPRPISQLNSGSPKPTERLPPSPKPRTIFFDANWRQIPTPRRSTDSV
ncbi:Oidioi.mRNA.OKI2018_I69.chr2.g6389.t1.cds [Oikopleura dioica]|uniref:Oidioi.mRNA.OKI2018_I69.chr2.g6389.t1.cds n=1 Tax=Oikopleura dioica TaxID=34765 RepID=A0ABN7T8Z6_OIKDI|nr:Oidioi.mRNA.OKI2018_I69.chr2.g6389.t1.cds [Oikopleura dioica]